MPYKVILAKEVDEMLIRHTSFIANVSVPAAERFLSEFEGILARLRSTPAQFPWDTNPNLPERTYRKATFSKWYRVVFLIDENTQTVYLDAVVDGRSSNT